MSAKKDGKGVAISNTGSANPAITVKSSNTNKPPVLQQRFRGMKPGQRTRAVPN